MKERSQACGENVGKPLLPAALDGAPFIQELKHVAFVRLIPGDFHRWDRAEIQAFNERGIP